MAPYDTPLTFKSWQSPSTGFVFKHPSTAVFIISLGIGYDGGGEGGEGGGEGGEDGNGGGLG